MAKSKAKRTHSTSLSGELNIGSGIPDEVVTITETMENKILTYDLIDLLAAFDGKNVSITIKEDASVEPTVEEGKE